MRNLVVLMLMLGMLFSGCIGGDDDPTSPQSTGGEEKEDPTPTETTGSITGTVIDQGFEPIVGVDLILSTRDGDPIGETITNSQGQYTFNGLEPETYRLIADGACCETYVENVRVEAGETTDLDIELERVRIVEKFVDTSGDWTGMIGCSAYIPPNPSPFICNDPNNDVEHRFPADPGLQSIVVHVEWETNPTTPTESLRVLFSRTDDGSRELLRMSGTSPLQFRIDAHEGGARDFNESTEEMEFEIHVSVHRDGDGPGFAYQQEFSAYYHRFYGERAPPDYEAAPDG